MYKTGGHRPPLQWELESELQPSNVINWNLYFQRRAKVPEKKTIEMARKDKRQGKAPTTQAGEFVREEMHHIREGKHGARSTKQAIAIGLSKARRSGVKLSAPEKGQTSETT